jgi:hypothetical protein
MEFNDRRGKGALEGMVANLPYFLFLMVRFWFRCCLALF